MFVIVKFHLEGRSEPYAVVPECWFDAGMVSWHKSPIFAKESMVPRPNWKKFPAELAINTRFATFQEADNKMDMLVYESSASEVEMPKRVHKKRKIPDFVYSSDMSFGEPMPKRDTPMSDVSHFDDPSDDQQEIDDPIANFGPEQEIVQLIAEPLCSQAALQSIADPSCSRAALQSVEVIQCVNGNEMTELLKNSRAMAESISLLSARIDDQNTHINSLTSELRKVKVALRGIHAPSSIPIVTDNMKSLPIATYADILVFEQNLDRDELFQYLLSISGKCMQKMVANLVAAVWTPQLQAATTWKGKRAADGTVLKHPLCATKMPFVIVDAVLSTFKHYTKDDVLTTMQRHLHHALDRLKKIPMLQGSE